MDYKEIHAGFTYTINGVNERVFSIEFEDDGIFVNGTEVSLVRPIRLTEDVFDRLGFRFNNAWEFPNRRDQVHLMFFQNNDHYSVLINSTEVDGLKIFYLHELQMIVYAMNKTVV
jgi:hypothetical protein